MTISQETVEHSLSPAAGVFTSQVGHTAQLIGEDDPETTRSKLRGHLSQFYEATAKELEADPPQHYKVAKLEKSGDVGGVYGGQRVILAPIGGMGTPVVGDQILAAETKKP